MDFYCYGYTIMLQMVKWSSFLVSEWLDLLVSSVKVTIVLELYRRKWQGGNIHWGLLLLKHKSFFFNFSSLKFILHYWRIILWCYMVIFRSNWRMSFELIVFWIHWTGNLLRNRFLHLSLKVIRDKFSQLSSNSLFRTSSLFIWMFFPILRFDKS